MPGYDDYLGSENGGLLKDFEATKTVEALFEMSRFGKCQLNITVQLAHPEDYPNIPDGVVHPDWYDCGPGWEPGNGGASITHPDRTTFAGSVEINKLLNQMKVVDPEGKLLANGTPFDASFWKGIPAAHWAPVSWGWKAFTAGDGSAVPDGSKSKCMPVELLGQAGTNGKAPATFDITSLGATPEQLTVLQTAASASKNVGEFQAAIIQPLAGQPVLGAVMKQPGDVYASLLVS